MNRPEINHIITENIRASLITNGKPLEGIVGMAVDQARQLFRCKYCKHYTKIHTCENKQGFLQNHPIFDASKAGCVYFE